MMIWLGKQYLGQRDRMDQEITGKDGHAIKITNTIDISKEVKRLVGILPDVKI
jgi:hypothetical protein